MTRPPLLLAERVGMALRDCDRHAPVCHLSMVVADRAHRDTAAMLAALRRVEVDARAITERLTRCAG